MACHDCSRARNCRAVSLRSFCDLLRSKSISIALGKSEDALGDDVALNLAGSRLDGVAAAAEIGVLPHAIVEIEELSVRAEDLLRGLLHPLIHLAPVDLLDRPLGARHAGFAQRRQGAIGVEAQDLQLEVSLRELLPHD